MKREVAAVVELTPRVLAEAFCDMDDDAQAQFFVEAADISKGWASSSFTAALASEMQWWRVGRHLWTCTCSTDGAREMVRQILDGMEFQGGGTGT